MTAPDLFTYLESMEQDANRPAWAPSPRQRIRARQRDYERLEPVAIALADRAGPKGFTADDLRDAAKDAGVITGEEGQGKDADRQRALSWFGPFLKSLAIRGLIVARTYPDGAKVKRASTRPTAKGNESVVYVAAKYAQQAA